MRIMEVGSAPSYDARSVGRGTTDVKTLLEGIEGRPDNFRMNFGTVSEGWDVPRHRHNFDQIRFPIRGEFEYAPGKLLPAGWVGYFPEGVYYGPQARRPGLVMLLLQFGGASGSGFLSKRQRRAAIDILNSKGRLEGGSFTFVGQTGNLEKKDEYTAIWECATGQPLTYGEARYRDLVIMNPEAYGWRDAEDAPGVSHKHLGTFSEREIRVEFIRLEPKATFNIAQQRATRVLFLVAGSVQNGDRTLGLHTAFACGGADGDLNIKALTRSEFLSVQLPAF